MRHSVHLMFGEEFTQSLVELKKYIIKYGEEGASPYLNMLLWDQSADGTDKILSAGIHAEKDTTQFISGLQNLYQVELQEERVFSGTERAIQLADYFDNLFRNTITINNPGESHRLHLCLYIPLYKQNAWEPAELLINTLMGLSISYQIDVIGLAGDTAFLFTPEKEKEKLAARKQEYNTQTAKTIRKIMDYKDKSGNISELFLLQNCQQDGLSLDLDIESYSRIIGEFALTCAEHYNKLFIAPSNEPGTIKGIGLSVLNFDKYYFVQYLLKRTYLHILDREKVTEEKVDINLVTQITQESLKDKTKLISDFYDKEVVPRLSKKDPEDKIIAECTSKLDEMIIRLGDDLQSFISNDNLSLPQKRATLAALLGLDDSLLTGYAYNRKTLIIDDLDREAANLFIQANNEIRTSNNTRNAILSLDKDIELPLDKIKELRAEMRQSTTYIREKEDQLKQIHTKKETAKEADKRLTEDGFFIYEGHKYRLLSKDIEEKALAETYSPPSSLSIPHSVDLRDSFTTIKSQGGQGACSAFSIAAIYEYILKRNGAGDQDLSEAFLYYNTRKRNKNELKDTGCSFYDAIAATIEEGICSEKLFPYNEKVYNVAPSEEAYEDGLSRLVKKAVNVNRTLNDLCAALTEGYPVAISLRVYDSFSDTFAGFVSRPTGEELAGDKWGNHAMVICGFDNEKKIFIVRNSWGTSFGSGGYCYIPFSYIEDKQLLNTAIIITEVESGYQAGSEGKKTQVYFDTTDADIQYAIINNLLGEEKYRLYILKKEDSYYREIYISLIEKLRNNTRRNQLIEGKEDYLQEKADNLLEQQKEARIQKDQALEAFRKETQKNGIVIISIILFIWSALGVVFYFTSLKETFSQESTWYYLLYSGLLVALLFLYFPYRKKKYRVLKEEWEARIIDLGVRAEKLLNEKKKVKLRFHIAGMILDRLFSLQDKLLKKYHVIKSFTGNLAAWYREEEQNLHDMDSQTKDPFISLITNEALDKYFEKNKEKIATDIRLADFLKGYEITEDGILTFKNKIKDSVILSIRSICNDFKLYSHISGAKEYPYLDKQYTDISKLLPILDKKSRIFLQFTSDTMAEEPHKIVFIRLDESKEINGWNRIYPTCFSIPPGSESILSPYKIKVLRIMNLNISQVRIANE